MRTSRRALLSRRATAPLPSVFRPEETVTDGATTLSPRCLERRGIGQRRLGELKRHGVLARLGAVWRECGDFAQIPNVFRA